MNQSSSSTVQVCNWCKLKGSHWTDACPALAKMRCAECGEYGHIDRFCRINKLKREKQQAFEEKKQWRMPETTTIEFCEAFYRAKLVVREPVDKYGYTELDRSNLGTQIYEIAQSISEIPRKYATKLTWFILRKGKAQVLQFLNSPAIIEELLMSGLETLKEAKAGREEEEEEEEEEEAEEGEEEEGEEEEEEEEL